MSRVSQATRLMRVLREDGVEDGVGDLVGHLVGVALGHRLRGEAWSASLGSPLEPSRPSGQQVDHARRGPLGHDRFAASGTSVHAAAADDDRHRVGLVVEARPRVRVTSLTTIRSTPLRVELAPAAADRHRRSRRRSPTITWPGASPGRELGQDVGRRLEDRARARPSPCSACARPQRLGPEVGHGGGHDHHVGLLGLDRRGPPPSRRPSRPAPPRGARSGGSGRSTVVTRVTSAPRGERPPRRARGPACPTSGW